MKAGFWAILSLRKKNIRYLEFVNRFGEMTGYEIADRLFD